VMGKPAGSGAATGNTADASAASGASVVGVSSSGAGSNILRITVTVELPPGAKAQVSQSPNDQAVDKSPSATGEGNKGGLAAPPIKDEAESDPKKSPEPKKP
jgi:hypothetical protein